MALTIGDLVALVRADDSGMRRGLTDAELRMRGFQRDTEGRLRDMHGRFVSESELMGRSLGDGIGGGADRARSSLARLAGMAGSMGRLAAGLAGAVAPLGAAVPLAAGLAATLANIAPAAGVAATGIAAAGLAAGALRIGLSGVAEAASDAFAAETAAELEEALEGLSPRARRFVMVLRELRPQFEELRLGVQQNLFEGLAGTVRRAAEALGPRLGQSLGVAAGALNRMGRQVINTAVGLGESGVLGQALDAAESGLHNLAAVPSVVVQALGQVAAAAGPSFARLTAAAGGAAEAASSRLTEAFTSGAMQRAIEQAIILIGDLVEVAGNVASVLGSVFGAAQASGGGFVGTLQAITGALAAAFASPAVQNGLSALFDTMATLAQTAGPLLVSALGVIAPVLTALGPPVQRLITALGAGLEPVITALGPVLAAAADAVGVLVDALSPLLPVVGDLIARLGPVLTPVLESVGDILGQLAPVVQELVIVLLGALTPALDVLPGVLAPITGALSTLVEALVPVLTQLMAALAPSLDTLGVALADLLVALSPLIEAMVLFIAAGLEAAMPVLTPLIELLGRLTAVLADELSATLNQVVMPAVEALTLLLRGDFSGALAAARRAVSGWADRLVDLFDALPGRAYRALGGLAGRLRERAWEAGGQLAGAVRRRVGQAVGWVRDLPGRAADALGDLSGDLWGAGWDLIGGFISGIRARIPSVRDVLGGLTDSLTAWKGPEGRDKRLLTPAGHWLIEGFQRGIAAQVPALRHQLQDLTGRLPGMTGGLGLTGAGLGAMSLAGMALPEAAGRGGAQPPVRVVFDVTGADEAMKEVVRKITRTDGL